MYAAQFTIQPIHLKETVQGGIIEMIGNYSPNREYTHCVVYSLVNCNALQHVRAKLNLVIVSPWMGCLSVNQIFDLETKVL